MKKLLLWLLLILVSIMSFVKTVSSDDFDPPAKSAFVFEVNSGKVLYQKNANETTEIASITKLLTIYLVYKEIEHQRLDWNDTVNISDYSYSLAAEGVVSNVPLDKRQYTVKELVEATLIANANSPAISLAEHISGSEAQFVDKMKKQLRDWGIKDTKLVNASGLNNEQLGHNIYPDSKKTDENMMSASDVAIIANKLLTDFPEVTKMTKQVSADFDNTTMHTYNHLLPEAFLARPGVDGLITGTSSKGGASFVATSTENGMRIVTVVLNADDADKDEFARFKATNEILDYILANYEKKTILKKGQTVDSSEVSVRDGKQKTVKATAARDLTIIRPINQKSKIVFQANQKELTAPVKSRTKVGHFVFQDEHLVGDGYLGDLPKVTAQTKTSVKRSFFLKVWWNHFVTYVNERL
ncbi:D-alanyl-D-alanine carboxypeptidase PBP3 [Streptococcus jiangjianxini]|uniref:D-alanyl-D-alanine carboxypeptidase PBP3 n=1 Tax=Streptococcus jiangjianxini TaxID=3161189 RepID=UPI0032EC4F65